MRRWGRRLLEPRVAARVAELEDKHRRARAFYEAKLRAAAQYAQHLETQLAAVQVDSDRHLAETRRKAGQIQWLRRRLARYEQVIRLAGRREYGSFSPPVEEWSRRWRQHRRRVVLFADMDYAGSFYAWAEAVNRSTDWAARLVVIRPHALGYPNDLTYGDARFVPEDVHDLLSEADVIHLKDEIGFIAGHSRLPDDLLTRHGTPIVFTQYGGHARARQDDPEYRRHVSGCDAVVCITPDLCFDWLKAPRYVPHGVDTAKVPYMWGDSRRLAHSPSRRARKGTDAFEEAVERLADLGLEVDLIEGVPHAECLERKSMASLFFDQAGRENQRGLKVDRVIGWYGNSALEAAVRGIPTIAHLSDAAFDGARRGGHDIEDRCAIINTQIGTDALEKTIRWYFEILTAADRAQLSRRTRSWVEQFHDYAVVGPQLVSLYESLT